MPYSASATDPKPCCPHCGEAVCAHDDYCLTCGGTLRRPPDQAPSASAAPKPRAAVSAAKRPLSAIPRALLLLGLFLLGGLIGYLLSAGPSGGRAKEGTAFPLAPLLYAGPCGGAFASYHPDC